MLNFVDISDWQRGLDLAAIPNLDGVIIKATEAVGYVDPSCDVFYQQAKRLGKKLGVYHFAGASIGKYLMDAEQEWAFFRDNCAGYKGEAIPVLDYEPFGYTNPSYNWVRAWVRACKRDWGVWPVVYMAGTHAWEARGVLGDVMTNCGLWYAGGDTYESRYTAFDPPMPPSVPGWTLFGHQYSSRGAMGGADALDINVAYVDEAGWDAYATGGRTTTPTPPTSNIDALATAVLRGDYGNGDERRQRLGDRYDAVQARVNEIETLARAVIDGDYGNGDERERRLGSLYDVVQARVNEIIETEGL